MLVGLWLLLAAFSLVTADEVRGWLDNDEDLRDTWAARAGAWLDKASRAVGAHEVRARLNSVRGELYGRRTIARSKTPAGAPATKPMARAAEAHAGQHHVAPRPRRVLLIGASSMQFGLGPELETALVRYQDLEVTRFAKSATGLSRPDVFDWPAKLDELMARLEPDLVITNFGGNDAQSMPGQPNIVYGTSEWDQAYQERVAELVRHASAGGARTIMIGMPVMRMTKFNSRIKQLNRLTQLAVEREGGDYVEQFDLSATPDGQYRVEVTWGGKNRLMRMPDGIHYTTEGGRYVVDRLLPRLERLVRLVPKDPKKGRVEAHRFYAPSLGRESRYLAWLPQPVEDKRYPLLVLLHGSDASPDVISEQAHDVLAQLAESQQMIIVCPDGGPSSWYVDTDQEKVATFIRKDLLADLFEHLPVSDRRGISGISMGGHGAITLALTDPSFHSASSISGVLDLTLAGHRQPLVDRLGPLETNRVRWEASSAAQMVRANPARARALPMYLSIAADDRWAPATRSLHQALTDLHIAHDYDEGTGGHSWDYFVSMLPPHVKWHRAKLARP